MFLSCYILQDASCISILEYLWNYSCKNYHPPITPYPADHACKIYLLYVDYAYIAHWDFHFINTVYTLNYLQRYQKLIKRIYIAHFAQPESIQYTSVQGQFTISNKNTRLYIHVSKHLNISHYICLFCLCEKGSE